MIPLKDDNPTSAQPVVTLVVIGLCVLVFLWQLTLSQEGGQAAIYALGFIPAVFFGSVELPPQLSWVPAPVTVFTSMFVHGGLLHLAGNMLYLWIFADNVEDSMGHGRFVLFYGLCGVAAALAQAAPAIGSTVPMIGASGAVSGVLGAYVLLYPHARVLVAVPLVVVLYTLRLPAILVLGIWFLGQLLSTLAAPTGGGGVAFRAHLGGFVAGLLLIRVFSNQRPSGKLFGR
ncbi:MAG TPA: rhomboid family intramembrane serine protease [Gammaproteobacteria bacterium]|nr:rhomboid family intramembrane serine protease [Gammaproteobacteria bacterium]